MSETSHPHEDPQTDYERMLEERHLDCSTYACWRPIRAFVDAGRPVADSRGNGYELGVCEQHIGGQRVTRWLES